MQRSLNGTTDHHELHFDDKIRGEGESVIPSAMRPIMLRMSGLCSVLKFAEIDHMAARNSSRYRIVPKSANAGEHNDVRPSRGGILKLHNHLSWADNIRWYNILEGAGILSHNTASGLEQ